MKTKLSLALILATAAFGAENLEEALISKSKITTELRASFFSKQDTDTKQRGENIYNLGFELGYTTDPLYGFYLDFSLQGTTTAGARQEARELWDKEQWGDGVVLSQAYLGYEISKTNLKFGRQYVKTPIIAGNPTRAFNEAFEGVSISSKDLADTTLFANYFYKFQGRTARVNMVNTNEKSSAPDFKDKVILAGSGAKTHEIDGVYSIGFSNKSIQNLTLSAQIALVDGVNWNSQTANKANKKGDISLYYAEANYVVPLESLKLKFDAQYRASSTDLNGADESKTGKNGENRGYDGKMIGLRAGFSDFYGLGGSVAYTNVTDKNALIVGVGNGATTYTMLPIRGPYVFTSHAGMSLFKYQLDYDLSKAGVSGLNSTIAYVNGKQSGQSNNYKVSGYSAGLNYKIPQVKGLNTSLTYTQVKKEYDKSRSSTLGSERSEKEVWLKAIYKFTI